MAPSRYAWKVFPVIECYYKRPGGVVGLVGSVLVGN